MIEKIIANTDIHYWTNENQSSSSILFIHPAFANHTCFESQLEYFKDKHKVIAIDLIGHGKSKGKTSLADTAQQIEKILDIENIKKINLVCISIGAILIQDFANKYPNRVESLCCIGGYDINNFDSSIQKENSKEQMKMVLKAIFSIKAFAKATMKISVYTKVAQDKFYNMNIHFKKSSFRHFASLNQLVNKYKTHTRDYPLMIGVGKHDNDMAIKAAKMWFESESNSQFVIFDNAGHVVNMDTPNEFNSILEEFLEKAE